MNRLIVSFKQLKRKIVIKVLKKKTEFESESKSKQYLSNKKLRVFIVHK